MSYDYKFRVLAHFQNCPLTYQFISEDAAMARFKRLIAEGWKCELYPIKHNTDPKKAEYEYRSFDVVELEDKFAMVLCIPNKEPEFHGCEEDLESCFDYIDKYWYEQNKS